LKTRKSGEFSSCLTTQDEEDAMAILEDKASRVKNLIVPAAASLVGAGAGLVLTRKPMRGSMPDLNGFGIGDLAEDLRGKVDAVLGKAQSSSAFAHVSRSTPARLNSTQLEQRIRAREQRRSQRRGRG
jgi:hypothetical protein